jgi:glycine oxidase
MNIAIIGAGVAGLSCAIELAQRGCSVEVFERATAVGASGCSWYAGGMLAPWCELESAEPLIALLGEQSILWWQAHFPGTVRQGSLVLAQGRDTAELTRFARRTERYEWVDAAAIDELEPELAGRFGRALYFPDEAHLDPRQALSALAQKLTQCGGHIHFGVETSAAQLKNRVVVDCTGLAARNTLTDLRGVKGEMLLLHSRDMVLRRPVRMLHPRIPVYVVPRGNGIFMVGATMIESDAASGITARSMLELLSAAYALHPAFGESEIIEIGTQVRPAFADNRPRIRQQGTTLYVNGCYRHGFLVAPALAQRVAGILLHDQYYPEVMDEYPGKRQTA